MASDGQDADDQPWWEQPIVTHDSVPPGEAFMFTYDAAAAERGDQPFTAVRIVGLGPATTDG